MKTGRKCGRVDENVSVLFTGIVLTGIAVAGKNVVGGRKVEVEEKVEVVVGIAELVGTVEEAVFLGIESELLTTV